MVALADEIRARIAGLSGLMADAQNNLAAFGEKGHPHADVLATNLRATIEAVQRELARAERALDRAQGLDAAVEILAKVRSQAQQGKREAKWTEIQANAKWAQERAAMLDAADAIMAPIIAAAATKDGKNKKSK